MSLGNNLFNARKKADYHKKKLPENLASAGKQSQNGNLMKHYQIFANPKSFQIYMDYHWMN